MTWKIYPAATFGEHHDCWQQILRSRPEQAAIAFLDARFIQVALNYFVTRPCYLAIYTSGQQASMALMVEQIGRFHWQVFIPSQLPLCAMVTSAASIEQPTMQSLLKRLPGQAMQLGLPQCDGNLQLRPADNHNAQSIDYIETAWVTVDQAFADYWASRSKNFRANHKKMLNRMQAENLTARFNIVSEPQDIHAAIAAYGELEKSGWKNENGTAIGGENVQMAFYADAFYALAAHKQAKIYQYYVNEQLIASDLAIEANDVQIVLKTAYAEAFHHLSPSTLLRYEAFQTIFNEGLIKRIEFYGKKLEWHTRWSSNNRTLYHSNYFRYPFIAKLKRLLRR